MTDSGRDEATSAAPAWAKVSHISFSVTDAEASARWLADVLGMAEIDRVAGDDWRAVLLVHPPSGTVLEFQQHDANPGDRFDPRRTGLDHIGFQVRSRSELDDWAEHLDRLGVDFSPVADRDYGSVLTFRHPDGIQLEMFYREGHP
jgi:glyoxylase I family protein